jgi:hypothetical protein
MTHPAMCDPACKLQLLSPSVALNTTLPAFCTIGSCCSNYLAGIWLALINPVLDSWARARPRPPVLLGVLAVLLLLQGRMCQVWGRLME